MPFSRTGVLADADSGYHLIMANIQADVLEGLAPLFPTRLHPEGRLILSGILTDQADAVLRTYESAGFALVARRDEGEWTGLWLRLAAR